MKVKKKSNLLLCMEAFLIFQILTATECFAYCFLADINKIYKNIPPLHWGHGKHCPILASSGTIGKETSKTNKNQKLTLMVTKTKSKMTKPFLWRYGRVDFRTERNIDRSSTKSPVTWQAVASWYIMCSVLKDYKWFRK